MSVIEKLRERIKQKGLGRTFSTLWKRYVFFHWELLWMERDLISPVPPHKLRPYEGLGKVDITPQNAGAFGKHGRLTIRRSQPVGQPRLPGEYRLPRLDRRPRRRGPVLQRPERRRRRAPGPGR